MINLGQGLTIYSPDGIAIVQCPITAESTNKFQLMSDDYVKLIFKSEDHASIGLGSYVTWESRKFVITAEQLPTLDNGVWKYELRFDAEYMTLRNVPFIYDGQVDWGLTANPLTFIQLIIDALNSYMGVSKWTVGTVDPTYAITITFSAVMGLDALTDIAEQSKSEWWFDGNVLNLSKCEHGTAVYMSCDDHLSNIIISDSDLNEKFNRLYAYGAARNIPDGYRQDENTGINAAEYSKRLRLPEGTPYIDSVEGLEPSEIIPGFKTFDTVYPRMICTVDNVIISKELTDANGLKYKRYFIHQTDIDWSDEYLTTETLSLTFQTGKLAGRTFELNTNPPDLDNQEWIDSQYQAWKDATYSSWCALNDKDPQEPQSLIDWQAFISEANCRKNFDNFSGNACLSWSTGVSPLLIAQNPAVTPYWQVCAGSTTDFYEFCESNRDSYAAYHVGWLEIVNDYTSFYIPNDVLKPDDEDTFILFNYNISLVSDQFISDAEAELLQVATDYMSESIRKRKSYECPTNKVWCEQNLANYIEGQRVHIYDERLNGFVASRIFSYEKKLVNKYECTYVVADTTKYSRLGNIEQKVDEMQTSAYSEKALKEVVSTLTNKVNNLVVGGSNMLLNSGFTGDYTSADLSALTSLGEDTPLYSDNLKYWGASGVSVIDESLSRSGKAAQIGEISQDTSLIIGEQYILSFIAKGSDIHIEVGGLEQNQELTSQYTKYIFKFSSQGSSTLLLSGDATIFELQLEKGTVVSDWAPSRSDNDKTLAEFQTLNHITRAIKDGSVDVLGGLILASMLQLGNYKNGIMQAVTAGVSGVYTSDDDPAFWGGGTFMQAIKAILSPEDPDGAKTAISHGGRLVANEAYIRGEIHATDGDFTGKLRAKSITNVYGPIESSFDSVTLNFENGFNFSGSIPPSGAKTLILPSDIKYDGAKATIINTGNGGYNGIFNIETEDDSNILYPVPGFWNTNVIDKITIQGFGVAELYAFIKDGALRWVVMNYMDFSYVRQSHTLENYTQSPVMRICSSWLYHYNYNGSGAWLSNMHMADNVFLSDERLGTGNYKFTFGTPMINNYMVAVTCVGVGYGYVPEQTENYFIVRIAYSNTNIDLDFRFTIIEL